jgi:hypothetical protein
MKNRLFTHAAACWLIAAGAASVLGIASGQDTDAKTKLTTIAAGSDYLQTGPGTQATLPIAGSPVVTLTGVPIPGFGNSDTIMQRTQDAVFSTAGDAEPDTLEAVVPITLTALNLTGTVAGPNGGNCTVNLTVAPSPASTGTLTLTKASATATSGGYHSDVNVYFNATFTPISPNTTCYPPITKAPPCKFKQAKGKWSTTPVAGEFLYTGTYPGVQYNQHTGLPAGYADFYMTAPQTDAAATAAHATCEALAAAGTPCPPGTTVR